MPTAFVIRSTNPQNVPGKYGYVSALIRWLADDDWAVMPEFGFDPTDVVVVDSTVAATVTLPGNGPMMPVLADDLDYLLRHLRDSVLPQFEEFFDGPWPEAFVADETTDPMVAVHDRALDVDQNLADIRKVADGYPPASDGERYFIIIQYTEGLNIDPRITQDR
jgi:hypothetical protein